MMANSLTTSLCQTFKYIKKEEHNKSYDVESIEQRPCNNETILGFQD
jgi:hypothetical protein